MQSTRYLIGRERESDEQGEMFELAWRNLCEGAGSNALHVIRPDSPGKGKQSGVRKRDRTLGTKSLEILTQNGDHHL